MPSITLHLQVHSFYMDYLTFPFHNPEAARVQPTPQSGNHHVQDPVEQLASPPPPRQDTTPGTTNNTNDSSSTFNRNDDDEDNDDSGTGQSVHRSISTLSSVSLDSVQLRQNHYAAFSKVRTVNTNIPQDISEEWRKYDPPSLTRGDWRSFGPTEAVLTVAEQCGSGTEGEINMRHLKKELEKAVSSLWKGTIWLTETHLIFVLAQDAIPERAEPQHSHTESWVDSLRRMLSHEHKEHHHGNEGSSAILTNDPKNGLPITAFQIPLSSLKKVSLKKHHHHKEGNKQGGESVASSSAGFFSPSRSTATSPALSRIQSRNPRASSSAQAHPQGNAGQGGDGKPSEIYMPGGTQGDEQETGRGIGEGEGQAVEFSQLVNRKDDPLILRLYSQNEKLAARVDLNFMSSLYEEEAKDVMSRLKVYIKH